MKAMRTLKLLCLLTTFLPTCLWGKGEVTYTRLQSLYSNAGVVHIDKVVLSDTATVMHCTAKGKANSWFQFAPSTYLSDEKAARYPIRQAVGLTLGEPCYYPKNGEVVFSLHFAPMPKQTKIFDLIEGTDKNMFRIYGIHNANAKLKIPVAREETDAEETAETLFHQGKVVVRGNVEGYSRDWDTDILFFNFARFDYAAVESYDLARPCTALQPDGTFHAEFTVDHPVWGNMTLG